MSSKYSVLAGVTAMIAMSLCCLRDAGAREKPRVIRHDGHYLDLAVNINVQWQSPNPVTFVRVFIGNEKNEIRVDEYDNRRNRDGYWGETTVFVKVTPNMYQNSIPYVIQIEDDLRQRSEQVQGSVRVGTPNTRTGGEDTWGSQHLNVPSQSGQQGTGYSYGSGQQGTGYSYGSGQQDTGYSYGSGQQDTGYSYGSGQQGTGYSYGSGQDSGSQTGGGTASGSGSFSIQSIEVISMGSGYVDFKIQVSGNPLVASVRLSVANTSGATVIEPQNIQVDAVWDGTTGPVVLDPGAYKAKVAVIDDKGASSPEMTKDFTVD